MSNQMKSKLQFLSAMAIFGTIGIFSRYIPLPSSVIAMTRGLIGTGFLILATILLKKPISMEAIRKNARILIISGIAIGVNWIFLFEAYRYTTVATATLCYYMAPIFVLLAAPVILKESMTKKKAFCVLIAFVGIVLVSGIFETGVSSWAELRGIVMGLLAAAFYATVILLNKQLHSLTAYDRTITQLASATVVLLPYVLLTQNLSSLSCPPVGLVCLLIIAIFHTGFAYALYFGAMANLPGQTIAIYSYLDPVIAILLSALFLQEPMSLLNGIGAVLILGAAVLSDFS